MVLALNLISQNSNLHRQFLNCEIYPMLECDTDYTSLVSILHYYNWHPSPRMLLQGPLPWLLCLAWLPAWAIDLQRLNLANRCRTWRAEHFSFGHFLVLSSNKQACGVQAAGADPLPCNFTIKQNHLIQQNCCNCWPITQFLFVQIIYFMTWSTDWLWHGCKIFLQRVSKSHNQPLNHGGYFVEQTNLLF